MAQKDNISMNIASKAVAEANKQGLLGKRIRSVTFMVDTVDATVKAGEHYIFNYMDATTSATER